MKILHLTLKKKWFDMIASGIKKEEYREVKPYWIQRLTWHEFHALPADWLTNFEPKYVPFRKDFDVVEFKNGYGKNAPSIHVECKGICINMPSPFHPEWIDDTIDEFRNYFIISLGDIIQPEIEPI
jgi:hypothetical protein